MYTPWILFSMHFIYTLVLLFNDCERLLKTIHEANKTFIVLSTTCCSFRYPLPLYGCRFRFSDNRYQGNNYALVRLLVLKTEQLIVNINLSLTYKLPVYY